MINQIFNSYLNNWRLQNTYKKNILQLASGKRVVSSNIDSTGLAIAENLTTIVRGISQTRRNLVDALSMLNIADSSMSRISDIIQRQRELAIQASNDTLTEDQREAINKEFQQLKQEIDRIVGTTEFNNKSLLTGETFDIQAGESSEDQITLNMPDVSTTSLGIDSLDTLSKDNAQSAIDSLDNALNTLNNYRTQIGVQTNRIEYSISNILKEDLNTTNALSLIEDTDYSSTYSNFINTSLLSSISYKTQAIQININRILTLNLLV